MFNFGLKRPTPFQSWLAQPEASSAAPLPATDAGLPVLVVGAGPAGLAAMAALRQAGVPFCGVEGHSQVGGIWDQSNPISSVYDGMQTNTSRYTTHLGPAMPAEWPEYPHSSQAHQYLVGFAKEQHIADQIRYSTRFENAVKTPRGTWAVTLRRTDRNETSELEARAIVFATGVHHAERRVVPQPLWDAAVTSGLKVLHSSEYRTAADFAGKRVLIVGIGNSGSDIADQISRFATRTLLAVRSTPWIVPGVVFGRPSDQLADDTTSWLPHWVQLLSFHFIQRLYVGHPKRLGLPSPQYQLLEKFAITDRGIVKAVKEKRVTLRTNVTAISNGIATFADANQPAEAVDVVIFATGYNRGYPLLPAATAAGANLSEALSFLVFHRTEPGLAYMAETIATRGCWPIFAEQGAAMAAYFAAERRGGKNVAAFNARRSQPSPDFKGAIFKKADGFHVDYHRYTRALQDLTAWLSE
ncbi:MAG: NAD(P)/FAD-dependent oxidoreductase [Planctomycetia bacterium]|nr:NAD(P)/FAD-dependent oxidoreductase [Planctomycetia bacterium]